MFLLFLVLGGMTPPGLGLCSLAFAEESRGQQQESGVSSPRSGSVFDQPALCEAFLRAAQQSSLGGGDAVAALVREYGEEVRGQRGAGGIFDFESAVLQLYELAPELRDLEGVAREWHLTKGQFQDLLTYYSLRIFDDLTLAGERREVLERLRQLNLAQYREMSSSLAARRWRGEEGGGIPHGYRQWVGEKSVPEMAALMGVSEFRVYADLAALGVSLVDVMRERHGEQTGADKVQSEIFIEHYLGLHRRGVSWTSRLGTHRRFPNRELTAVEMAVRLQEQGESIRTIAGVLNEAFGTEDPSHPQRRTEASVRDFLRQLGGEKERASVGEAFASPEPLYHPDYGYLKDRRGQLQRSSVLLFVYDRVHQLPEMVAPLLETSVETLMDFLKRAGAYGFWGLPTKAPLVGEVQDYIQRHEDQRHAVEMILNWILTHERMPRVRSDYGPRKDQVHLNHNRLFGEGQYNPDDESAILRHRYLFRGLLEGWLSIKRASLGRDPEGFVSLVDLPWHAEVTPDLRKIWQEEVVHQIFRFIKRAGEMPQAGDFGRDGSEITVSYSRFLGKDRYSETGEYGANRIFSGPVEAWLAVKRASEMMSLSVPVRLVDVLWRFEVTEDLRREWQKEVVEMVLEWKDRKEGRWPQSTDFGKGPDQIPIRYGRVFGTSDYREGHDKHRLRVFDSPEQGWAFLRAADESRASSALPR